MIVESLMAESRGVIYNLALGSKSVFEKSNFMPPTKWFLWNKSPKHQVSRSIFNIFL